MESKVEQWFSSQLGWSSSSDCPALPLYLASPMGGWQHFYVQETPFQTALLKDQGSPSRGCWDCLGTRGAVPSTTTALRLGTKALTNLLLIACTAAWFDLVSGGSLSLLERLYCCKKTFLTLLFWEIMLWGGKVYILCGEEGHWSFAFWHLLIY